MEGVLKIRNIDSLRKLSLKRAMGKRKHVSEMYKSIDVTLKTLEEIQELTPELLCRLIRKKGLVGKEIYKLDHVIFCRQREIPVREEDVNAHLNRQSNLKIPVLLVPYEFRDKYSRYIYEHFK
jgi:hypothetical protein